MVKVSLIVPVYNVNAEYFQACMNSLLLQTYQNIEIILVDDGSNNGTERMCDDYAREDIKVKVLHQANQGVSAARNHGTSIASGDYIMYVDSDDILVPFTIEEALMAINKSNADVVLGAIKEIDNIHSFNVLLLSKTEQYHIYSGKQLDLIRKHLLTNSVETFINIGKYGGVVNRGPYVRLIKNHIAKKVKFRQGVAIGEDVLWNMQLVNNCSTICFVPNIWYGYLIHQNSTIRGYRNNREKVALKYLEILWKENQQYCEEHITEYVMSVAIEFYCIMNYEMMSSKCTLSIKKKQNLIKQYLLCWPWMMLSNKELKKELPIMYQVLFSFCNNGMWVYLLKLWNSLKKRKIL